VAKCPKCEQENPAEALFCMKCGAKLERKCPQCGAEYPEEALFCIKCGAKLSEARPTAPPRLEDMQKQLQSRIPRSLADRLFAGAKQMQGEHRLVTAIFADVVGSSGMARNMPLDQYVDTIDDCFKMMVDTISVKYEGSINRFIGDCVLAFFGAPITHENDAERAILAALYIRDGVKELNLDVSIGINTGMTYVGEMGSDLYLERSAWGPDVDFAKRLQEAANPGDIYVGASTYRLTSRAFDFDRPVEIQVKGMQERQIAYPVLHAREHPEKLRGIEGLRARMIGREREFAALMDCADALMTERRGQIVTIMGEAGIGKSRLVRELNEYLKDKDVRWLEGRCLSIGQSISFWPFIDMMRTYLGISGEDSEKETADKLVREMASVFGQEAEGIIPYVGHMLSIKLDERYRERIRYAAPEQIRRQTLLRMRDIFVVLARRQPLIVILEDMHWADDLSLDLLWVLMDELVAAPMLLICVHRPEREHGSWQIDGVASSKYLERYTRLSLNPLTPQQTQQMVESLLTIENLPSEARAVILEKTEGNPFFVEEVVRLLIEQDTIYQEGERWRAKETIRELAVPDTIQSVILSRIDRLHEELKYVLQCASVIGKVFQRRLLGYLAGQEESMEDRLSQLEASQMVYRERIVPELEYAFKHALTQEATYQRMLSRQRRMFHERVGEGIESLYQEQIEDYYERLAYHYNRSDNKEKAIEYLVKAGQKAANRYADREALDYFHQALEIAEADEDHDRILGYRAELLLNTFRGKEAASDYQRLLKNAKQIGDRKRELEAVLGLASAHYVIALDAEEPDAAARSREFYESAYALARELDDNRSMVRALVPTTWFTDFWPEYRDQAAANSKEALALSQQIGDEDLIIDSKMASFKFLSAPDAEDMGEELISQIEPRHDLIRLKEAYYQLMWIYRGRGNFERCVECCDVGIHLAAEVGAPPVQYWTLKALALMGLGRYDAAWGALQEEVAGEEHRLGTAMKDLGTGIYFLELMAYEKASEMFENVIEQGTRLKRAWMRNWGRTLLAVALVKAGQLDEASPDRITQDLASTGRTLPPDVMAEIHLSEGRLDEALKAAGEASSRAEEGGRRPDHVSALESQLRVLLRMGKPEEVVALADKGIRMAEEMSYLPMLWRIRAAKARALEMIGKNEEAAQEYEAAAAIIRKLADTIPDAELRQILISNPQVSSILAASDGRAGDSGL
jgi:class 3 adenylate cyclase/tetratricopeptide (TPR) repeat protein/ribosomal protein L40E/ABC-type dipeptide/oligopeptide/nickel transport system ATPase component